MGLTEWNVDGTMLTHVSSSSYIFGLGQSPYSVSSTLDNGRAWAWGSSLSEPGDAHVIVQGTHYCATANWAATDLSLPRAILQLSDFSKLGSCALGGATPDTLEYCYARSQYYSGDGCEKEGDVRLWGTVNGQAIDQAYELSKVSLAGTDLGEGLHLEEGFNFLSARIGDETRVFCVSYAEDDFDVIGGERKTIHVSELGTCGASPVDGEVTACVLPQADRPFP